MLRGSPPGQLVPHFYHQEFPSYYNLMLVMNSISTELSSISLIHTGRQDTSRVISYSPLDFFFANTSAFILSTSEHKFSRTIQTIFQTSIFSVLCHIKPLQSSDTLLFFFKVIPKSYSEVSFQFAQMGTGQMHCFTSGCYAAGGQMHAFRVQFAYS